METGGTLWRGKLVWVVYENLEDNADKIMREFVRNVKLAEKNRF